MELGSAKFGTIVDSSTLEGGGVYVLWLSDSHYYGGRAKEFKTRWRNHLRDLRAGKHENPRVQAVFKKYGQFEPRVILALEDASFEALKDAEQKWLDEHFRKPGCMNLSPFADGGCAFRSEETRRKMSATRASRPDLVEKAQESLARNQLHLDPEKKRARLLSMAANTKGKRQSPEHVSKRASANRGRKNTPETIAQMSESAKRRAFAHPTSHGSETRALISKQQRGRVWVNNGLRNSRMFPDRISVGWSIGRI